MADQAKHLRESGLSVTTGKPVVFRSRDDESGEQGRKIIGIILGKNPQEEEIARGIVDMAQAEGMLEGKDPEVLLRHLLSPKGQEWIAQRTVILKW